MSSVSNIQRRFGLLFTLPSLSLALLLSSIVSTLIVLLGIPFRGVSALFSILFLVPLMIGSLLFSVGIERLILRNSAISTIRRLLGMSIVPLLFWLMIGVVGVMLGLASNSIEKFYSMILIGMFLAVGIRVLILGGIFFEKLIIGFLAAFIQPILLILVLIPFDQGLILLASPMNIILGSTIPITVLGYQLFLVRHGKNLLHYSPLNLLRMFLLAWASDRPKELEEVFEKESSSTNVVSTTLDFDNGNNSEISMIIPGVHPGPFYPVGSSNLPFQLFRWFSNRKILPSIFHGISGHDLNLPSQASVMRFMNSMADLKVVTSGHKCTPPLAASMNRGTVTGMVFGNTVVLVLSLAPYGGEDFPRYLKQEISASALSSGFSNCLLIDSHNSRGSTPSDSDCSDLISVAGVIMSEMKFMRQSEFQVGYAHSAELTEVLDSDIGPAGISLIMFKLTGRRHLLVSVDSNNVIISFREKVLAKLEDNLVELCTTDTHFNASKVMNPLGYLALGDISKAESVASIINRLALAAAKRVTNTSYKIKMARTDVDVFGGKVLDSFSNGLDKMIRYAKLGGIISSIFIISTIALSAVL